jgi:hypothetical protein
MIGPLLAKLGQCGTTLVDLCEALRKGMANLETTIAEVDRNEEAALGAINVAQKEIQRANVQFSEAFAAKVRIVWSSVGWLGGRLSE